MQYRVFCTGRRFTIEISTEAEEYLEKHATTADRATVVRILNGLAEEGQPRNEQKMRDEGEGIYAVKGKQLRLYGWYAASKRAFFVCGTGDIKKTKKADAKVLKRAKRLRVEYEEENSG